MSTCPHCQETKRQVRAGFDRTGSQRYQCQLCQRSYTPEPLPLGYNDETKQMAVKLYVEGNGFRRIGRLLGVNAQSVANWVNAAHTKIQTQTAASGAKRPETLEVDELFTFVGTKKSQRLSSP